MSAGCAPIQVRARCKVAEGTSGFVPTGVGEWEKMGTHGPRRAKGLAFKVNIDSGQGSIPPRLG